MSDLTKEKVARDECEHCLGTGMADPECETCEAKGWVDDPDDGGTMVCPDCLGEECEECEP